jgi:tripartite-type tricarboxylate transporter receptor subunit TctC
MIGLAATVLVFSASTALAQFPSRAITVIEPFSSGGAVDAGVRTITEKASELLGERILIDPRPGGGTRLGTEQIVRAPKDGYTLGVMVSGSGVMIPALDPAVGYDPLKDFTLLNLGFETYYLLVANPNKGIKSLGDLIAAGKSIPGKLNYATLGVGTSSHIWAELFQSQSGTRYTMVAYRGEPQALVDVMNGEVDFMFVVPAVAAGHAKAGKVVGLAVTGTNRMEILPDVPTVAEAGVPGYSAVSWVGFVAPAGLDEVARTKLVDVLQRATSDPAVKARLGNLGFTARGLPPKEFEAQLRSDLQKVRDIGKKANIVLGK